MAAPDHRPLAGGAALAAASRVSVAVSGAGTTLIVARLLGADGAGEYAVALTVVLLLTTFGSLGVEHGIAFYVSGRRWAPRAAFRAAVRVALGLGLAGAGAAIGVRIAAPSAFAGLSVGQVALVAAAAPFALTWFLTSWVALSVDRYERYVLPPAVQSVAALVLVAVGAGVGDVTGALAGLTAAHVVAAALTVGWTARGLPERQTAVEDRPLRRALSFGIRGYGANALQFVNLRVDLFVLSAVASTAAVGHYAIAVSVTSVMLLLPQALNEVLFPRVAALTAGDAAAHAHREFVEAKSLRHLTVIVTATGAALVAGILLLIVPLYGHAFRSSVGLALILLPGAAALGVAGALGAAIVGRGRPGISLLIAAIITPLTLALYATLIPALHAEGAALASTLSYVGTLVASAVAYRRLSGRPVLGLLLPTIDELRDYRALAADVRARLT